MLNLIQHLAPVRRQTLKQVQGDSVRDMSCKSRFFTFVQNDVTV